jgi:Uncharacterized protein conserved in bacteria
MIAALFLLWMALPAGTTSAPPPSSIAAAATALAQGRTITIGGGVFCSGRPLALFYRRRRNERAWTPADQESLLRAIRGSTADGLSPADYHLAALDSHRLGADETDLLLTDAFFLLGSHLLSGRVDPVSVEPTWCLQPRSNDLVAALESALEMHEVEGTLARMAPAQLGYVSLRRELALMRRIETAGGWPRVDSGRALMSGSRDARVQQLVARLRASRDLAGDPDSFDSAVDVAVRRFQRLHGLAADGVVGAGTLNEINRTVSDRVRQVELNLERWRWLPPNLGDPYAMINIPAFSLDVYEHGRRVLTSRVVVGKNYQRTPILSSSITEVVLSPYWNVPQSIASRELWPKEHRRPGFLRSEHIEVLGGGRLRQAPGPWNALGLIKFNLPNRYDVYLHDTPAKTLFQSNSRAFSHGCMRVEKPVDLAAWLLRDRPEWTRQRIVEQSERRIEQRVAVKAPLAIHVLYWTAFVGDGDELYFAPDIYGRDGPLDEAMRAHPSLR